LQFSFSQFALSINCPHFDKTIKLNAAKEPRGFSEIV